jgi:hypothetical protein
VGQNWPALLGRNSIAEPYRRRGVPIGLSGSRWRGPDGRSFGRCFLPGAGRPPIFPASAPTLPGAHGGAAISQIVTSLPSWVRCRKTLHFRFTVIKLERARSADFAASKRKPVFIRHLAQIWRYWSSWPEQFVGKLYGILRQCLIVATFFQRIKHFRTWHDVCFGYAHAVISRRDSRGI